MAWERDDARETEQQRPVDGAGGHRTYKIEGPDRHFPDVILQS